MRPPVMRLFLDGLIVDSFAGGGGASTGIEMALGRSPDIAINHNAEALAMHAANHPLTRHYRENVWEVDPVEACGDKRVALLWLSPDCTTHSRAKGGVPFRDPDVTKRSRGLAWVAARWAKAKRPDVICLENVREFKLWGPLIPDGEGGWIPDPEREGETFDAFVRRLRRLGYVVDWREFSAADYGAPTSRERLFMVARCDGRPIVWPEPTHAKDGAGGLKPWRSAAEIIDWSIPCPSIFLTREEARAQGLNVKRPLADNTLKRIARGVQRYVLDSADPFIVPVSHTGQRRGRAGVDRRVHSIREPMPTVTGGQRGNHALVVPALIQSGYGERKGQAPRVLDIQAPLGTVVGGGQKHALVAAFLAQHNGGMVGHDAREPVSTIVGKVGPQALVTSSLLKLRGGLDEHPNTTQDVRGPVPTVTASGNHLAELRVAMLMKYYGVEQDPRLDEPLHTITTRDRFALVTVTIAGVEYVIVDIGMRMLTPRELFRAQGFPEDYRIDPSEPTLARQLGLWLDAKRPQLSKSDQVRCCGNSVCPPMAAAIVRAQFEERVERRRAVA